MCVLDIKCFFFCVRLCFQHQIHKLTYSRHCASDLQTSHMTICSQGGSTSEDDELNKDAHHLFDLPQFFFWLARHFSLKGTWLYGNSTRGGMLNTPPSPSPALCTLQMSVWHPVHCSTRMVLKELLISMFSMLPETWMWQNRTMRVLQRGSALTPTKVRSRGVFNSIPTHQAGRTF